MVSTERRTTRLACTATGLSYELRVALRPRTEQLGGLPLDKKY